MTSCFAEIYLKVSIEQYRLNTGVHAARHGAARSQRSVFVASAYARNKLTFTKMDME